MKKLFKTLENKLSSNQQVNFTEEDPTYEEAFSYIGEQIRENKYYILGFIILAIIAKLI